MSKASLFETSIIALGIGEFFQIEESVKPGIWRPIAGIPKKEKRINLKEIEIIVEEITGFEVVQTNLKRSSYRVSKYEKISPQRTVPILGGICTYFEKV